MAYCAYVRKSRADLEAEARGEGETLTRHINTLLELAKRRNERIDKIYKEIVSGETIASRPVMQHVLTEIENGMWEGVYVVEVERLARGDTIDQGIVAQTFKFSNTKIITPIKDYDPNDEFDEEYFEFGLFMSRREYKTINRRLQRGRIASVKEGKYLGSVPPYGYKKVRLENDKGFTLAPEENEADIVRMMYDWYVNGELQEDGTYKRLGTGLIAKKLDKMKIAPRKGNNWAIASVRDILRNETNIGKIRWNRRATVKRMIDGNIVRERPRSNDVMIVDGIHQAIVDIEIFEKTQEYMNKNKHIPLGQKNSFQNPLSGLVVCDKCGHKMQRRPHQSGRQATLMCPYSFCDNISSDLSFVEKRLLMSLQEWVSEYKLNWEQENKTVNNTFTIEISQGVLKKISAEIDKLKSQLSRTHDLLEQGIYSAEDFFERSRNISERIKENEEQRANIEKEISAEQLLTETKKNIIPKVEHLLEVYNTLPSAKAKNDMLKEVIEKAVYLKTKNGRWHNSPDDFELKLYPKIPVND